MMTQQYTLVLPIKIHSYTHHELNRFIHVQLRSLNKFLHASSIYEFLIICKENEIASIQKALLENPSPLPIRLIPENSIVKQKVVDSMNKKGWYLQQLLKLGVSKIIKTPLYLILDADCFLTKPFSYQDLFHAGKILMDKEPWTAHSNWWIDSLKIIDDVTLADIASRLAMGVTPQILVTNIVLELLDYLDHKEKSTDWDTYLHSKQFTEFSLYWLFLIKTKREDLYNHTGSGPLLMGNFVWNLPWSWRQKTYSLPRRLIAFFSRKARQKQRDIKWKKEQTKQLLEKIIQTDFENNDYFYFSLIQSNINEVSVDWMIEITNKYLT